MHLALMISCTRVIMRSHCLRDNDPRPRSYKMKIITLDWIGLSRRLLNVINALLFPPYFFLPIITTVPQSTPHPSFPPTHPMGKTTFPPTQFPPFFFHSSHQYLYQSVSFLTSCSMAQFPRLYYIRHRLRQICTSVIRQIESRTDV